MVFSMERDTPFLQSLMFVFGIIIVLLVVMICILRASRRSLPNVITQIVFRFVPTILLLSVIIYFSVLVSRNIYAYYNYKHNPRIIDGQITIESIEQIHRMGIGESYNLAMYVGDVYFPIDISNDYSKDMVDILSNSSHVEVKYVVYGGKNWIWDISIAVNGNNK